MHIEKNDQLYVCGGGMAILD